MARKLDFDLVFASSSDRSKDAEDVTRDLKDRDQVGWVSKKFCTFPQIVIFKLKRPANITRIQVVCHDTFVPETEEERKFSSTQLKLNVVPAKKVEFFAASASVSERNPNPRRLEYEEIASTEFLDNSGTNEEYKERRSIFVDCEGQFIKFKIHKNHHNSKENPKSQESPNEVDETEEYLQEGGGSSGSDAGYSKERKSKKKSSREHSCSCECSAHGSRQKKKDKSKKPPKRERKSGRCPGNPLEQLRSILRALVAKKQEAVDNGNVFTADNITAAQRQLETIEEKIQEYEDGRREALEADDERAIEIHERRARRNLDLALIDIAVDNFLSKDELARLGIAIGVDNDMCYNKTDQGECGNPNHKTA